MQIQAAEPGTQVKNLCDIKYHKSIDVVELITEDCHTNRVPIGNSGLVLLKRDEKEMGISHVGFQLERARTLMQRVGIEFNRSMSVVEMLGIVGREYPETRLAILDVVLPMPGVERGIIRF